MPLRLFDLKHLTSGHPTLQIADLWMRGGIDFSSSEPLNVHFTFSAFRIGHSHEKKTQQSTAVWDDGSRGSSARARGLQAARARRG
eukprot:COSAG02_NODE_12365_length_1557_cov_3.104938_4_plen_85_part_01